MPRPPRLAGDRNAPATIPRPVAGTFRAALPVMAVRAAGHHPFIYRKMIISAVGGLRPNDGDLVRVVDRDHLPIGFGLWNDRSQISLRLLSNGASSRRGWSSGSERSSVPRPSGASSSGSTSRPMPTGSSMPKATACRG